MATEYRFAIGQRVRFNVKKPKIYVIVNREESVRGPGLYHLRDESGKLKKWVPEKQLIPVGD